MLIKSADDKEPQIAILKNLLAHERVPLERKRLVERELRSLSIGMATEKQAAYEIDFYAARSKNLCVIHDLRLEIDGRIAQIDHILINRLLEVFVLETKTFSTGLSINELGEFSTIYEGKEVGIPSPVEQNARHISVLKDAFKEIGLPKRLGITLQPSFHSVVLVSPKSVINRPQSSNMDASIIKLDQFFSWYDKKLDEVKLKDTIGILKLCSSETVIGLGKKLHALHTPSRVDYIKKFELEQVIVGKGSVAHMSSEATVVPDSTAERRGEEKKYFCANCKKPIAQVVAKYCWNNKSRFGGKAYCRVCQENM